MTTKVGQGGWSSKLGFVFAAMGSAIGLGSIWKFPYMVGENGGGTFLLFYMLGLLLIVLPLMVAEFLIGRHGRSDAMGSFINIAREQGISKWWGAVGLWGVIAGFLILSFYSVIGGWTLAYVPIAATDAYVAGGKEGIEATFTSLLADPWRLTVWHGVFIAVTAFVVAWGIGNGIERAVTILMPLLFVILIALAIYAAVAGDLAGALTFLLTPDPAKFTADNALAAIGLGFFSIGTGIGLMITYAAYVGDDVNLTEAAIVTIVADTAASFLAGLAIFPIVFAAGLDPAGGPGLMFLTLPVAFQQMPYGEVVGTAFFVLLFVSALASAMSILELVVSWLNDELGLPRALAAGLAGVAVFVVGLLTVWSFNTMADWRPFAFLPGFEAKHWFDSIDHLTSNVMLPLGGMLIAIFVGWVLKPQLVAGEAGMGTGAAFAVFRFTLRFVVPLIIAVLFVMSAGGE